MAATLCFIFRRTKSSLMRGQDFMLLNLCVLCSFYTTVASFTGATVEPFFICINRWLFTLLCFIVIYGLTLFNVFRKFNALTLSIGDRKACKIGCKMHVPFL